MGIYPYFAFLMQFKLQLSLMYKNKKILMVKLDKISLFKNKLQ